MLSQLSSLLINCQCSVLTSCRSQVSAALNSQAIQHCTVRGATVWYPLKSSGHLVVFERATTSSSTHFVYILYGISILLQYISRIPENVRKVLAHIIAAGFSSQTSHPGASLTRYLPALYHCSTGWLIQTFISSINTIFSISSKDEQKSCQYSFADRSCYLNLSLPDTFSGGYLCWVLLQTSVISHQISITQALYRLLSVHSKDKRVSCTHNWVQFMFFPCSPCNSFFLRLFCARKVRIPYSW